MDIPRVWLIDMLESMLGTCWLEQTDGMHGWGFISIYSQQEDLPFPQGMLGNRSTSWYLWRNSESSIYAIALCLTGKKHIIVVDDEALVLQLFTATFVTSG